MLMKTWLTTIIVLILISSCADDRDVTDSEAEKFNECREQSLEDPDEIQANFVGSWKLDGFGCSLCGNPQDSKSYIKVSEDGTGLFLRDYDWYGKELLDFNWKVVTEPWLKIETDPLIFEISSSTMCSDYIVHSSLPTDGIFVVYKKQ